jgi:hypothetical protein
MNINFIICGRLGNAIFRYLACSIMCINYDGIYSINNDNNNDNNCCNELLFNNIKNHLLENKLLTIKNKSINMSGFYQHDLIYIKYKTQIFDFINNNESHYILTDGINAGDGNNEKFFMKDIINTPKIFNKIYKNVLHIRLEDFVGNNLYIPKEIIIELFNKNILHDSLCIVCKKPSTEFELDYINYVKNNLEEKNIKIIIENNDVLTDYYIMKEAEILICSKSTLSWCAAFFSDKIQKCYMPEYTISENQTCKYPINNTEFY